MRPGNPGERQSVMGMSKGKGGEIQGDSSQSNPDLLVPLHSADLEDGPPEESHDDGYGDSSRRTNFGAVALTCSLLVNMLCLILLVRPPFSLSRPGSDSADSVDSEQWTEWSRQAALDAEAASAFKCAGHGAVFVDTLALDANGLPVCECNQCFTGPDCSESVADCGADVASGDPLMLEEFWKENSEASAVVIPGWYRMSYWPSDGSSIEEGQKYTLDALEHQILALHDLVGNAVTKHRYIVLGTGSTQLINAAISSISELRDAGSPGPVKVVAASPYLGSYASEIQMFRSTGFEWAGDARQYTQLQIEEEAGHFIELVASPNNPDGKVQDALMSNNGTTAVYDLAYYWPHYAPITSAADHDIMLFTLSTLTGHAGSRVGWAVVKDQVLAERMSNYVWTATLGVSHESQFRAAQLLKTVVAGYRKTQPLQLPLQNLTMEATAVKHYARSQHLFHYAHALLRYRWERLQDILFNSSRFSLQELEPQKCLFFDAISPPSPAYAWIRCNSESDQDCLAVLREAGIWGRGGVIFGSDSRFVRLSLIKREAVFDNLVSRLAALATTS